MSRKNHEVIDGRLLRTDKTMRHLKGKQLMKITSWLKTEFFRTATDKQRKPTKKDIDEIVDIVYMKIEEAQIWIPYYEVRRYMSSKQTKFWNQWVKQNQQNNEHSGE